MPGRGDFANGVLNSYNFFKKGIAFKKNLLYSNEP